MDLSNYKKILIIRLSSLGDVLLTTPLIRTIKQKYPNLQIDYLIRKEYEDTIKYNPHLNEIIAIERNYNKDELALLIGNKNYELIIDLQNNLRSRGIIKNCNAKIVRYKKPYIDRFLLVRFKINRFKKIIPIPVRYANALNDFELDEMRLELFLPDEIQPEIIADDKLIGFCPGSQHFTKMWPEEYFIELGNALSQRGFKIILLGGKSDVELCQRLQKKISGSVNLANNNQLLQLASNMKQCKFIVTNDSGMMHTALSVNIPVVALFGSTVEEFGFFPYNGKNLVIENNDLNCRPCSHIGKEKCPKRHFNCMNSLSPKLVLDKVIKFSEGL